MAVSALIIGCGYLGARLAPRLIERRPTVYGTTRGGRVAELAALGVRPLIVSVTQPVTFAALRPAIEAESLDVYYLVPPGRMGASPSPRQVVIGGVAHLVKQLRHANVRRAVLASSSAVYGQTDGRRIDADTPPEPAGDRARLLLEGERLWLNAGEPYHVIRFAGLYGPQRVIGLRAVADGSPIVGNPDALLNLIHVDDAVDLLLAVMDSPSPARIELGCDGRPVARRDYYTHLAQRMGLPAPAIVNHADAAARFGLSAQRLARTSSKSLDNILTCRRTGWRPRHTDYRAALDTLIQRPAPG